ncbi:MAG TPA: hypothetical protein VNH40_12245 [Gaiellaceae bacterium]|nr:hypothetical protein [Gaiellaceae bacterium]
MKHRIAAAAGSLALLAAAASANAQAAAKPGFLPGTWKGQGVITGSVGDGPMATTFRGKVAFTLRVSRALRVSGTGIWKQLMLGSEAAGDNAVNSTMKGSAALKVSGSATNVTFAGTQHVVGVVEAYGLKRALKPFDRPLAGRLVITRAGKCRVVGRSPIQPGVTLAWSALLQGSGTCNA